jgi:hypothetical protein
VRRHEAGGNVRLGHVRKYEEVFSRALKRAIKFS